MRHRPVDCHLRQAEDERKRLRKRADAVAAQAPTPARGADDRFQQALGTTAALTKYRQDGKSHELFQGPHTDTALDVHARGSRLNIGKPLQHLSAVHESFGRIRAGLHELVLV